MTPSDPGLEIGHRGPDLDLLGRLAPGHVARVGAGLRAALDLENGEETIAD